MTNSLVDAPSLSAKDIERIRRAERINRNRSAKRNTDKSRSTRA